MTSGEVVGDPKIIADGMRCVIHFGFPRAGAVERPRANENVRSPARRPYAEPIYRHTQHGIAENRRKANGPIGAFR